MSIISERFNELLIVREIKLDDLANAIKVSLPTVYEWRAGKGLLIELADYFDCTIDELIGRER